MIVPPFPHRSVRRNSRQESMAFAIAQRIFPSERALAMVVSPRAPSFSFFPSLSSLRLLEASTCELSGVGGCIHRWRALLESVAKEERRVDWPFQRFCLGFSVDCGAYLCICFSVEVGCTSPTKSEREHLSCA